MPLEDENGPQMEPLGPDEELFLVSKLAGLFELVDTHGLDAAPIESGGDTPEVCDEVVRWWHAQPSDVRPEENDLVWGVAVATGEVLRTRYRLDWALCDPAGEPYVALVGQSGPEDDARSLVVAIIDSVSKRFESSPEGFVVEFLDGLDEHIASLRRADDEDPPQSLIDRVNSRMEGGPGNPEE